MRGNKTQDVRNLIVHVDLFKKSGKWYHGEDVNIGTARLWSGDVPQAIVDNLTGIGNSWMGEFIVVVSDLPISIQDPNYHEFNKQIFFPDKFVGLRRSVSE